MISPCLFLENHQRFLKISSSYFCSVFHVYVISNLNVTFWLGIELSAIQHVNVSSPSSWWRHQMETFSALLAICAGNSPVPGEFPAQRPVTRSFDVFFDLRLNKRLSKQSWGWWFETLSRPLWRHRNVMAGIILCIHPCNAEITQ